jgi:hypothetical protein
VVRKGDETQCSPFLSDTEIVNILKGSDVWMDSDEIERRLQRIQGARNADGRKKKANSRSECAVQFLISLEEIKMAQQAAPF